MSWRSYPSGNKYHNRKVERDGIVFDSVKEFNRYLDLKVLEKAGLISELQRQVKFVLIEAQREPDSIGKRGGKIKGKLLEREAAYIADFTYRDENGELIVEDTKGIRTPEYVLKRKLMLKVHGIQIKEI